MALRKGMEALGLVDGDSLKKLGIVAQMSALITLADIDEARLQQDDLPAPERAAIRNEAIRTVGDMVNIALDDLRTRENLSESQAIARLRTTEPELIEQMDRLLADGGDDANAGNWLATREKLAKLREEMTPLAKGDGLGGTELQQLIAARQRDITMELFDDAVAVLGPPPVPFSVVSLGGTARGETSLSPSLQFGFVLPEDHTEAHREYFTKLARHVQDQVTALGEDGSRTRGNGFRVDPEVNPGKHPELFMNSADELIRGALAEGGAPGLTGRDSPLFNAEWLFGSDSLKGDDGVRPEPDQSWKAVQRLHDKLDQQLDRITPPDRTTKGEALGRAAIRQGVEQGREALARAETGVVDVRNLAQLPEMLVQGLLLEGSKMRDDDGIVANSFAQQLDLLVTKGKIGREDARKLEQLHNELVAIRLRSHAMSDGPPTDLVALKPGVAGHEGLMVNPRLAALVDQLKELVTRAESYATTPRETF
jgi:hypothetical protein